MPNNFRKTPAINGFYISKDGDDGTAVQYTGANETAARDSPRNTITDTYINSVINIIGAGYYQPPIVVAEQILDSDGKVVIDRNGGSLSLGRNGTDRTIGYRGIHFKNFRNFTTSFHRAQFGFSKCFFEDCEIVDHKMAANGIVTVTESIIYNSDPAKEFYIVSGGSNPVGTEPFNSLNQMAIDNTYFQIKVIISIGGVLSSLLVNRCAFINPTGTCVDILFPGSESNVTNCAFSGKIQMPNNIVYSSFNDQQLAIDYPDFVNNQGNIQLTQDIHDCFNNIGKLDFSLKITSQLIQEQFTIGARDFRFAKYIDVDAELTSPTLTANPPANTTGFKFREVTPGQNNVQLTSGAFLIDPDNGDIAILNIVDIVNELNFDTDLGADQPQNQNVPAVENFGTGTNGGNPKRLTFEIRTSRNAPTDEPDIDADWDNSFNGIPAGDWVKHEFNEEKFVVDNTGKGKGNVDFDPDIPEREFVAVWMQIRITLRRDFDL